MIDVRVQAADFDPGRQLQRLAALGPSAIVSFSGHADGGEDIQSIWIDHYPPLARSELARIGAEAEARWGILGTILIHRHGRLLPGDRLLFAAVAAADPGSAQAALAFLVEKLRSDAPFWRKESRTDGSTHWSRPS